MNSAQTWHQFWSSFNWKAYDESTVPENAPFPRITYSYGEAEFEAIVPLSVSLWTKSLSWEEITLKSAEIGRTIGLGGRIIPYTNGKLWIRRGSPFSQRMSDEDDTIRRIVLNVEVEFLTSE